MLHVWKKVNEMFSLVLPAYNESKNLERCVSESMKSLKGIEFEIIIAEDGSRDGTDRIAARLAKKYKNVRHIHSDRKLGKGRALTNAFRRAKGSEMGTIDVDMATDARHIKELALYARKYDAVTGSRYAKGSIVKRPLLREFVSRSYNLIAKVFLGSSINDLQCGFKSFSRRFVENEIFKIEENTWAWDTIVLLTACRKGYRVLEFPVEWNEKKEAKHSASFKRIFSDVRIHGKVLAKLFMKYRLGLDVRL